MIENRSSKNASASRFLPLLIHGCFRMSPKTARGRLSLLARGITSLLSFIRQLQKWPQHPFLWGGCCGFQIRDILKKPAPKAKSSVVERSAGTIADKKEEWKPVTACFRESNWMPLSGMKHNQINRIGHPRQSVIYLANDIFLIWQIFFRQNAIYHLAINTCHVVLYPVDLEAKYDW